MRRRSTGVFGSRLAVAITSVIVTAVVVAGGIAVASVPNNSVGTRKIIDNSVRSVDIRNGAVKSVDIRNGTIQVADVTNALRPLWAKVDADSSGATLIRGRGVVAVGRAFTGIFSVQFARNINRCGWIATINANDTGAAGNGQIAVQGSSETDTLAVRTYSETGVLKDPDNTDGFTVQAVC